LDSVVQKNGDEYDIILNNTMYNDISKADDFYQGMAVQGASYEIEFPTIDIPRGVYIGVGITLFIGGVLLTAGGGAAIAVFLLGSEPAAIVTAGIIAGPMVTGGLTAIDLSVNMLTEGKVDPPTEALPPSN
jgi:hypothetical protein